MGRGLEGPYDLHECDCQLIGMAGISQGHDHGVFSAQEPIPDRPFNRNPADVAEATESEAKFLPLELRFVAQLGFAPELLWKALRNAPDGVRPLDVLLGEGVIPEESYYRALARYLGSEYYCGEPLFATDFDALRGLRCGVAPLEWPGHGPKAVIAPDARSAPRLIEMTLLGHLNPTSFAVTPPQGFVSLVRTRRRDAILSDALGRLPYGLSAQGGMSASQFAAAGLTAALAFALANANLQILNDVISIWLWPIFLGTIGLRSIAVAADNANVSPRLLPDDELYTVVAAVYREADVIHDLVKALDALDYPKSKLDIKIVVEERDHETLAHLLKMGLPARYEVIVAPPGDPSTKPRALNIALSGARGELLVVYDAEDVPSAKQLRLAASKFASEQKLDCLQARLTLRNGDDSWLMWNTLCYSI
jgi:hypothetical protein